MDGTRITLSALWVALVLTYLYGDVLRILSGDMKAQEAAVAKFTQGVWLGIAVWMAIPIAMVVLSLTLDHSVARWANIIVAVLLFGLNLIGLPTYPSAYDKFLIVVGLVWNALTVWYAWKWA
jgi:Family of unknown function (DUF6326)